MKAKLLVILLIGVLATVSFSVAYNVGGDDYQYRRVIENTSSDTFVMPLNESDVDSNGTSEWFYGQDGYLYYNNESSFAFSNGTQRCGWQTNPLQRINCPNPPSDLHAYFTFDEDSGDAWEVINNYNASSGGGVTKGVSGQVHQAYSFDGSDDYANLSSSEYLSLENFSSLTIVGWAQPNNDGVIIAKNGEYALKGDGGALQAHIGDGSWQQSVSGSTNLQDGNWHHVAYVWDGSNLEIFVNGSSEGSVDDGITSTINNGWTTNFGNWQPTGGAPYNGSIDDVRIYETALTSTQITNIMNSKDTYLSGTEEEDTGTNSPPNQPTLNNPSDGATGVVLSPTLNVTVSDPDGNTMDVYFYNATTNNQIGSETSVANNSHVTMTWSGLEENTTYSWYVNVTDGINTTTSSTWSFETLELNNTLITVNTPDNLLVYPFVDEDPDGNSLNSTYYGQNGTFHYYNDSFFEFRNSTSDRFGSSTIIDGAKNQKISGNCPSELFEYLPFDNDNGFTFCENSATVYNDTTTGASGVVKNAYQFAGDNEWVSVNNNFSLNQDYSLVAWIKYSSGDPQSIIDTRNSNSVGAYLVTGFPDAGKILFGVYDGTNRVKAYTSQTYNDSNWHLVTATWDDSENRATIYINGSEVNQSSLSLGGINRDDIVSIGRYSTADNKQYFNGSIDDVQIWTRLLSNPMKIYNATKPVDGYDPELSEEKKISLSLSEPDPKVYTTTDLWINASVTNCDSANFTYSLSGQETDSGVIANETTAVNDDTILTGLSEGSYTLEVTAINASDDNDTDSSTVSFDVSFKPSWRNYYQNESAIKAGDYITLGAEGQDDVGLKRGWLAIKEYGNWTNFTGEQDWYENTDNPLTNPSDQYVNPAVLTNPSTGKPTKYDGKYWMATGSNVHFWTSDKIKPNEESWSYVGSPSFSVSGGPNQLLDMRGYDTEYDFWLFKLDTSTTDYVIQLRKSNNLSDMNSWTSSTKTIDFGYPNGIEDWRCVQMHNGSWFAIYENNNEETGVAVHHALCNDPLPNGTWDDRGDLFDDYNTTYEFTANPAITLIQGDKPYYIAPYEGANAPEHDDILWGWSTTPLNTSSWEYGSLMYRADDDWEYEGGEYHAIPNSAYMWNNTIVTYYEGGADTSKAVGAIYGSIPFQIYGSPNNTDNTTSWTWTNFTWRKTNIETGPISWKICYEDTNDLINCTDETTFNIASILCEDDVCVNTTGWWSLSFNSTSQPLTDGVDNATAGDTLNISVGTYNEDITVDKNLDIVSSSQTSSVEINNITLNQVEIGLRDIWLKYTDLSTPDHDWRIQYLGDKNVRETYT